MKAIKNYFKYAVDFVGVCGRKEFWIVYSLVLVVQALCIVFLFLGPLGQLISILISLSLALPTLSIMVRRLHDTDRSGLYLLWLLFPFVGFIIILTMLAEKTRYFIPE